MQRTPFCLIIHTLFLHSYTFPAAKKESRDLIKKRVIRSNSFLNRCTLSELGLNESSSLVSLSVSN